MANTFTSLHYHIVFSTKNREPWITQEVEKRVWEYLGGIAREKNMVALQVGGIEDRIHMLVGAPATMAPATAARLIKGGSSSWLKDAFPDLKRPGWQDGYGAFTVSKSKIPEIIEYIKGQRNHHQSSTFKQEYLGLLKAHEIEYDLRYVFE